MNTIQTNACTSRIVHGSDGPAGRVGSGRVQEKWPVDNSVHVLCQRWLNENEYIVSFRGTTFIVRVFILYIIKNTIVYQEL